jgi:DNA invertase Pin-like site-specific DNA recombinase
MKAVIFARVSSKEQEEGHSLDAQLKNNRGYCEESNLEVIKEFKVVESSTIGERPEFYKMMNFIEAQSERVALVCHCADRLQRDFASLALIEKLKKEKKLVIHFSREKLIYDDESDDIKYHLDVILAHRETKQLGKRVKTVFQKKIEEGTICGDSPLGYLNKKRYDKKKDALEVNIDPERGHLVKKLFEMYSTGLYSMQDLCTFVDKAGLRSKKNNKISKSQVEKVLKNPFYYGFQRYNGELHKHIHPRLISKELFDECQLVKKGRGKTKSRRTQKPFIFKGLLTCSHCGCVKPPKVDPQLKLQLCG